MQVPIKLAPCLLLAVLVSVLPALPQEAAPSPRIVDKVDESQLLKLRGNTHPAVNAKNDRGRANPTMPMSDLILVLKRSPEQQAAFDSFVASQYDSTSANYHRWFEPAEVGERFGPSLTDIAAISSWLTSHGLSADGVSKDRMTIRFSGTAGRVEAAFHTEIHNLSVNGEPHFSNMTDPQIPMALEPVVLGPKALHNFVPRPMHRSGGKAILNSETGRWERTPGTSPFELSAFAATLNPQPELGINQGVGASTYVIEDVTPYDFATIYNVLPLWYSSIDGTGQTIAIAGRSNVRATDVASFRKIFGLPPGTFNTTHNGPDPGYCTGTTGLCTLMDQVENALDVEWAGAVAKGATIELVVTQQTTANDAVYESAHYVISNKTASILSVSYGLCELFLGSSGNAAYNSLWQTAAAEGIAVFVASGDAGAPACDQGQSPTTPYSAQLGLSVNGVASSPFDTVVGGTDFTWCNPSMNVRCASGAPYWGSTNSTSTGANAQSYIPEVPWNDTCTTPAAIAYIKSVSSFAGLGNVTDAESACNFIDDYSPTIFYRYGTNLSFLLNVKGTGGGASSCTAGDGANLISCSGGHAKPSWQNGVAGVPDDGKRDLPDVSFFAGTGFLNSAYLICVSDIGTCLSNTSPVYRPTGGEVGGTSVGTPVMAGVMALINQKAGSAQGNPNSELYQIAKLQSYSRCASEGGSTSNGCIFNDVANGTNAMVCSADSSDCIVSISGDKLGVLSGQGATAGYDLATGLGTLNVANLVSAWPSSGNLVTPTITVTPSSSSIKANESLTVSVSAQGSSGTPTGRVTLSGGGYSSSTQTLSSGSTTFTIPANGLRIGTDMVITGDYSGDSTYTAASGTTVITVTEVVKLAPTVTVTPASNSIHVNESLRVSVAVAGSSGTPTGTVSLSSGVYTSSSQALSSGSTIVTIPGNSLTVGTDTLTASYSGDSAYAVAIGTTSVTVTEAVKQTPTVTAIPASTSIKVDQSLNVSVTVQGASGTPTGSVTLSGGDYSSGSQTLSSGATTFAIPANTLHIGTNTLTASYSGDSIYAVGSGETVITVTAVKLTPTITVTPSSSSINRNQILNVGVSVTGSGTTPTGALTLTSGGYTSPVTTLVAGAASFTIPANVLSPGIASLMVSYGGDTAYIAGTSTGSVTVSKMTPSLTVSPDSTSIHVGQGLNVTVTVSGPAETPTGTVMLSGGGYSSSDQGVSAGRSVFSIPAGLLALGSQTLTVLYSGDSLYLGSSASTNVRVTAGTYGLSASMPPAISRGGSATSTVTVSSNDGYSGTVMLTCALTVFPSGATHLPTCTVLSESSVVSLSSSSLSGTGKVVVTTTGVTSAQAGREMGVWASSGAALAFVVLFVCPRRSRRWRAVLIALMLAALLNSFAACGGSGAGENSGSGIGGHSGTTAGIYSFTVIGTGNPAVSPTPSTSFSVTVN